MVTSRRFAEMASALPNVVSAPHFDRTAFKVRRIFATLAADGQSANFCFAPEEQDLKCMVAPEIFERIDNGWGRQGWTRMQLANANEDDLATALTMAYAHAVGPARKR